MNWHEFTHKLVTSIHPNLTDDEDLKRCCKLIRKHDKMLSANGDFSCPSNTKVWQQVAKNTVIEKESLIQVSSNKQLEEEFMLIKVQSRPSGRLIFKMDRKQFMKRIFQEFGHIRWSSRNSRPSCKKENALDIKIELNDKSDLTNVRCLQVGKFAQKLLQCDVTNLETESLILSTSPPNIDNSRKYCVAVGPVLDKSTKKKSQDSFLDLYKQFYDIMDDISKEREAPNQSDHERLKSLHILISAEIQFQLLGSNICQPVILDKTAPKLATFVLYNHARIVQLLKCSKYDSKNDYLCPSEVTELLNEEEEWEIIFVYMANYLNLIQNTFEYSNNIKVGRICQFLVDLCNTFSRYYNRIHIIKKSDHLKPLQNARLHFISVIKIILEHGLMLMDISCLEQM